MNSSVLTILIICALVSAALCRESRESQSRESRESRERLEHHHHHHEHHHLAPICPPCDWSLYETYAEYVMKTLKSGGPPDGRCESGYEKWIYQAKPYGLKTDVCCCLKVKVASIDCRRPASPVCPAIPKIGRNEYILDYFFRVSNQLKDAPENGCCPLGTFKWIFEKALTGAKDLCSCIDKSSFQDDSLRCV